MSDKNKNRVFKPSRPTVELTESMLPELKDLEIGEETTITIKVKVVALTEGNRYGMMDEDEDGEGGYYEREYGKAYADAKRKDEAQLRGTFKILSADEDANPSVSHEQEVANKIMASRKRKVI